VSLSSTLLKSVILSSVHPRLNNRPNCCSDHHTCKTHHLPSQSRPIQPEEKPICTSPLQEIQHTPQLAAYCTACTVFGTLGNSALKWTNRRWNELYSVKHWRGTFPVLLHLHCNSNKDCLIGQSRKWSEPLSDVIPSAHQPVHPSRESYLTFEFSLSTFRRSYPLDFVIFLHVMLLRRNYNMQLFSLFKQIHWPKRFE